MDDFRVIVERHLAGELNEADHQTLAQWLEADESNRRLFLAEVDFYRTVRDVLDQEERNLATLAEASRTDELPPIHIDANALTKEKYVSALSYVIRHTFTPKRLVAFSTAAALMLGMVILIVMLSGPSANQPFAGIPDQNGLNAEPLSAERVVATLTAEYGARWDLKPGESLRPGNTLVSGQRLTLTQGIAEITTKRGAIAILEAPASIELLDNDNAIRLHRGKLVGLCHSPASKGFVLKTDHADITDLGTEFGVHARPNAVTTTVFTGKVNLSAPGGQPQPLVANQTARINVDGNNREVVVESKLAQGFERLLRPTVVIDARINLAGFDVRVVPRGVYEDAQLFTDRIHEINGIDENGIPDVLRGGDLIMMPGDARPNITPGTQGLELQLDLAKPADIYLLMPDSRQPPAWLKDEYEKTSLRVGHDRGEGSANETPAIGPGNSIDNKFIVWKRSAPAGTITASYGINFTMYSLIVVPKEEGGGATSQ